MVKEIVMPKLGETMEEGAITKWLVAEGQAIKKGDLIMEVETDKVTLEVESLVEGELLKIVVGEGTAVPIGTVVGYAGQKGDELPQKDISPQQVEPQMQQAVAAGPVENTDTAPAETESDELKISPRALKLAIKLGVDIGKIPPAAGKGRLTAKDVQAFYDNLNK